MKTVLFNLNFYRKAFKLAALYNFLWGTWVVIFPYQYFELIDMRPPQQIAIWQVVGMCILVYAPGYWWAANDPIKFRHYILIGLLGKVLGPIGFVWSVYQNTLPINFGITLIFNDLIWWPIFAIFLYQISHNKGGWLALIQGK